ncbi:MAG: NADPH-dependent F420 reductase [Gemmatimonadota bacterium]
MKVAVIGTGKMGRGFAHAFAPKHELVVGLRDPDRARVTAASTGAAAGATYADASAQADVVILTVPWTAMDETLAELGDLQDVVVVDVSYPDNQQQREALEGRSTAEVIQSRLPHARVFKGWNHVHAKHSTDLEVDGIGASVLIAGDDPGAR